MLTHLGVNTCFSPQKQNNVQKKQSLKCLAFENVTIWEYPRQLSNSTYRNQEALSPLPQATPLKCCVLRTSLSHLTNDSKIMSVRLAHLPCSLRSNVKNSYDLVTKALGQFIQENQGFEIKPMSYYSSTEQISGKNKRRSTVAKQTGYFSSYISNQVYRLA